MIHRRQLEQLFVKREGVLFNIALRWTWNEAEAAELVQEAFLRVWARRRWVVSETANAYLFKTLNNLALKHARRRKMALRVRSLLGVTNDDDANLPEDHVDRAELRLAISKLKPAQRSVLLLAEFSGLSQQEIGDVLNIPIGTVGSRKNAALAILKGMLND